MARFYKNNYGIGAFFIDSDELGNYTKSDFMVCDKCGVDLCGNADIIFIPILNKAYCSKCGLVKFFLLSVDSEEQPLLEERENNARNIFGVTDESSFEELYLQPDNSPLPAPSFPKFPEYLKRLRAANRQMGQTMPDGASTVEIDILKALCEDALGMLPPQDYFDFLRYQNGFEFNEQIIYGFSIVLTADDGCYDFLDINIDAAEETDGRFLLGRGTADDIYVYDIESEKYVVLNYGDTMEEFDTFGKFIKYVLESAL